MRNFFAEQGRTRVYAETDFMSVAGKNPRRTPLSGKRAIYGWTLTKVHSKFSMEGSCSKIVCRLLTDGYWSQSLDDMVR